MSRVCLVVACALCVEMLCGCSDGGSRKDPAPVPTAKSDANGGAKLVDSQDSSAAGSNTEPGESSSADPSVPHEVKLEGISLIVPPSWKKVPPANRIIEAEFSLPRVEGDEFDGRLTIMPAGGDTEANIDRWKGEFVQKGDAPPKVETVKIDGVEAVWVDLRGDWRGSSGASGAKPQPPRTDYRMLAVIVPFSEMSSYFIKLTGPRETIAAREEEFRSFVKSAHLRAPAR